MPAPISHTSMGYVVYKVFKNRIGTSRKISNVFSSQRGYGVLATEFRKIYFSRSIILWVTLVGGDFLRQGSVDHR
jgi:hypothetical protein